MKTKTIILMGIFTMIASVFTKNTAKEKPEYINNPNSNAFYEFSLKTLDGKDFSFEQLKGKKVIILNTASECGYTKQYKDWQAFHEKHGKDIIVLGFPCNQFGGQEPGTSEEIATFCEKNYGVTFSMFQKLEVKGKEQHPLYKWLSDKSQNGWNDKVPSWNFCKYVINEKGTLTHFFASGVKPQDDEFLKAVGLN